jgi:hypothetical protein
MKQDVAIDELTRKLDQVLGRLDTLTDRLAGVENFVVHKRKEEYQKRKLEEEMWTKSESGSI